MSGRPRKYNTAEEMQGDIDTYFQLCVPTVIADDDGNHITDKNGKPIYKNNPPTITGLALALGFESRQSLYDYEKNGEFSYTIKKARLLCENYTERGLLANEIQPAAGIFVLKNYGWTDKQEVEHSGRVDLSSTIDEIRKISDAVRKEKGVS